MHVYLETERLILRRFTADDVDNLVDLDGDSEVMRFVNGGMSTPRDVIENDTLPNFLRYYYNERSEGYGFWAAIEKTSGAFLGWFHFRPPPGASQDEVELGYRLRKSAWSKGYGTEGARALIRKGFTELGVQRVIATAHRDNIGSRQVMEKAGMEVVRTFRISWPEGPEGPEQEAVEYALRKADWEQREARRSSGY
jgi:RimJ/RimL family protein N-acetyltransferase